MKPFLILLALDLGLLLLDRLLTWLASHEWLHSDRAFIMFMAVKVIAFLVLPPILLAHLLFFVALPFL